MIPRSKKPDTKKDDKRINSDNSTRSRKLIPKRMQTGLTVITLQEAIKKSLILK